MADVRWTQSAVLDLSNIWNYTRKTWSEKQADKYYSEIIEMVNKIGRGNSISINYDEISPNLYGSKINRHIIFYRILDESLIEIVRILHERMDLENRIAD